MERLDNEEYPYFKPIEIMGDELTKDSSSNNGEIKLSFPTRSGSNILVSFNPFHESWIELYIDECRDKDETAKKLEKIMSETEIDKKKIESLLPHREPMLLIDKLINIGKQYIKNLKELNLDIFQHQ